MPSRLSSVVRSVYALLPILGLVLLWEVSFRLVGLNPKLFPPPSAIIATLFQLFTSPVGTAPPPIYADLGSSLARLILSMGIAVILGPLIGILMGTDRRVHGALHPLVNALLPIPPYAYIPILLLWLGQGSRTIVTATAFAAALPLIYTTTAGVQAIDRRQVWALQSFGAGRLAVLRLVVLPAAFAAIVSGLRQSFGQGWRTLIGGEFIAAPNDGLGSRIFNARDFLAVDVMFSGILLLSVLGYLSIYVLVGSLEDHTLVRWGLLRKAKAR